MEVTNSEQPEKLWGLHSHHNLGTQESQTRLATNLTRGEPRLNKQAAKTTGHQAKSTKAARTENANHRAQLQDAQVNTKTRPTETNYNTTAGGKNQNQIPPGPTGKKALKQTKPALNQTLTIIQKAEGNTSEQKSTQAPTPIPHKPPPLREVNSVQSLWAGRTGRLGMDFTQFSFRLRRVW